MDRRLKWIYSQMTDKEYVLAGEHALYMSGLYTGGFNEAQVYTGIKI